MLSKRSRGRCTYDELSAQVDLDDDALADALDGLLDDHLVGAQGGRWGLTRPGESWAPVTSSGATNSTGSDGGLESRLARLKRLREEDLIDPDEYADEKRRLLDEL